MDGIMDEVLLRVIEPWWREAAEADLPIVHAICQDFHPSLLERLEVFGEKLKLFPAGCRVLVRSGEIVGYGFSYPWLLYSIPPNDTFLDALPSNPDCIFIHDVVVMPHARRHGAAKRFIEIVAAVGRERNISALAAVSVYNTHPIWAKCGFEMIERPDLAENLESYGETARYIMRRLREGGATPLALARARSSTLRR
jgi:GNAT superfamily N-acetyltransferase